MKQQQDSQQDVCKIYWWWSAKTDISLIKMNWLAWYCKYAWTYKIGLNWSFFLLECLYQGSVYRCEGYRLCCCFYDFPIGFWNSSGRAGLKQIGPIAPNCAPHFIYSRLFKHTQQHTAGFTENSSWAPHLPRPSWVLVCSSALFFVLVFILLEHSIKKVNTDWHNWIVK